MPRDTQSSFNLHCKYVLLTYPQSDNLDIGHLSEHLGKFGSFIIGRERHADGGIHFHAFVDFQRKRRFRNARCFDVDGHHPNIVPSRGSAGRGYDYATKDHDIVAGELTRPGGEGNGTRVSSDASAWAELVEAETRDEFFALLARNAPKALICSFPAITKYADWKYAPSRGSYETPKGWFSGGSMDELNAWSSGTLGVSWVCEPRLSIPEGTPSGREREFGDPGPESRLVECVRTRTGKHGPLLGPLAGARGPFRRLRLLSLASLGSRHVTLGRPRSVVVYGPTRVGKTVWARSLGEHIYFCGLYSGSEAMRFAEVGYAVFDDMGGLKYVPQFKNWLGGQMQFQVKQLYRDPTIISWGKPSIWLANNDPRDEDITSVDREWLEGNCDFIYVGETIFHANTE